MHFAIEREIWKRKSVFKVDFLLYPSIGKSRKGIQKLFLWTLVLLTFLMHECVKLLFLRTVLFGSPKEMEERKINEQFSQCSNSFLDFRFDCKSKSRFFKFNAPLTWTLKSCFYSTAVVKIYITNAKIKINCILCIIICSLQWEPIKCS